MGGLQTPVSGRHNGTASFANPTLSPTSELYKLKGTTDSSYCMKSEQGFPLWPTFLKCADREHLISPIQPNPAYHIQHLNNLSYISLFLKTNQLLSSRKVLRACWVFRSMCATFMWGWMHIMRSHIVSPTEWTSNVSEWKLLHQGGNTRATGAVNVGQMEWPLTCWGEVKCEQH